MEILLLISAILSISSLICSLNAYRYRKRRESLKVKNLYNVGDDAFYLYKDSYYGNQIIKCKIVDIIYNVGIFRITYSYKIKPKKLNITWEVKENEIQGSWWEFYE